MTTRAKASADRSRAIRLAVALVGLTVRLGRRKIFDAPIMAAEPYPDDYRLRHPVAVTEGNQSIVVFIGQGRSGMTAGQRADVMGMAQTWLRESTGVITVEVPVGTPNARSAAET